MARTFAPPGRATLRVARHLEVRGVVQGVGFRPFVWRLAAAHHVAGWVRNDGGVVTIHAEGEPGALDRFEAAIAALAPPLARVDDVSSRVAEVDGAAGFDVVASEDVVAGARLVSPDAATCAACLRELFDPSDRRFRYPFVNCTDCGPRFTIIEGLPYDRERTSMRTFAMCEDCRREYEDPADRRFHAEPVACPRCGPRLRLVRPDGVPLAGDPVEAAATLLRDGAIVAVKGLGGYQLACDATREDAVGRLRDRKRRPSKPFAVMVATLADAEAWTEPTDVEREVLTSWRAPIVLVRDRGALAPSVAPGHRRQGLMLPSTPLHHLLTRAARVPLVMTSGNASDEPICVEDDEALARLGPIADAFLVHDRPIVSRYDDSVVLVRTDDRGPTVVRRARSFAPHPIALVRQMPVPILGTGALLHGAFCLASGRRAFLSQHIGDLDTDEAMRAYVAAFDRARAVFRVEPEAVAHDLHPDLPTTRFAASLGLPAFAVQHHHAHVAATMAEHGLEREVLGIAFDGLGFGEDGTIWGGEFLRCSLASSTRIGRLRPVRQPGGDAATAHPWRMALAHAADTRLGEDARELLGVTRADARVIGQQLASGLASPFTSSAGRLFDAVAALLGICRESTYEGEPAILLEQAATRTDDAEEVPFERVEGLTEIDTRALIAGAVRDLAHGLPASSVAGRFHASFARVTAEAAGDLAREHRLDRVVLGGGVFQNDAFTTAVVRNLRAAGLTVYLPREVPVGDGGIALGQAVVAAARMEVS